MPKNTLPYHSFLIQDSPVGMVTLDELLNILKALRLTGGCDDRTLGIVAQATSLGDYWTLGPAGVAVIEPDLLERGQL